MCTESTVVAEEPTQESYPTHRDYSLVGKNSPLTIEHGLADAAWYQTPVSKETMRDLLQRRNWPAIRDTAVWFGLMIVAGFLGWLWWGTWWAIVPFTIYGVLYGSTSDSRWHESSHGTAFKSDWMNDALYEIASFMVMRESTLWRWSHTRHHSDTLIVGRDPEIAVPRPPSLPQVLFGFTGIPAVTDYFKRIAIHSLGKLRAEEATFVPQSDWNRVFFVARIHVAIYLAVAVLAAYFQSILPFMYVGLPNIYGAWLLPIYSYTQHAGLAENVLDHRANCRTVYMNLMNRFLYWNMNYHLEHHMFPLVPYHNLPRLHAIVKEDMPAPYNGIWQAYREIIPAVLRQSKDPGYYVRRKLPKRRRSEQQSLIKSFDSDGKEVEDGWVDVCADAELLCDDVCRFDHGGQTFAVYRTADGSVYATDGMCTHGRVHLAGGFVKGNLIECSKHNGRFDVRDGSPQRLPVCVGLKTYPVKPADGRLKLNISAAGGVGAAMASETRDLRVVSSRNVATFIKEVVLEPIDGESFDFAPGEYLQLNIPSYDVIDFGNLQVDKPFDAVWRAHHVFDHRASNHSPTRRNYSLATNPDEGRQIKLNVRIATPPHGIDCPAGSGSTYVWNLKPGDEVSAIGPFGDFHIKNTEKEMIYVGGGAGMAPLRSHLSHLFETLRTNRRVSYWYGARSKQEVYYDGYFENLARRFENFSFRVALSEPLPEDHWSGYSGFIHEILDKHCLSSHPNPVDVEYYVCGPPKMVAAVQSLLTSYGVPPEAVAFDEF